MIEALNRDCFCISLDRDALRRALETLGAAPLPRPKRETPGRAHAGG